MTPLTLALTLLFLGVASGHASGVAEGGDMATLSRDIGMMGTRLSVWVQARERSLALEASEVAIRAVEDTERRLSTWGEPRDGDGRELLHLNQEPAGTEVALSPLLARELAQVAECVDLTGGAFDPAIGALLAAWDVRGAGRVPDSDEIGRALEASGFEHLRLEPAARTVRRVRPGVVIEEGGFGKGAGLDRAAEALTERFGDALAGGELRVRLNLGGQLMLLGDETWTVPVADPEHRDAAALILEVTGGSVATSGNSERGFEVDGARYSHILDPRTGRPAADFGSLTVIAPHGLTADCLATGLYVLGKDAALAFAARTEGVEVLIIGQEDGRPRTWASAGLEGRLRAERSEMRIDFRTMEEGRRVAWALAGEQPATP